MQPVEKSNEVDLQFQAGLDISQKQQESLPSSSGGVGGSWKKKCTVMSQIEQKLVSNSMMSARGRSQSRSQEELSFNEQVQLQASVILEE